MMEDLESFGPSAVVAVGLDTEQLEQLQDICSERRHRLVVAARRSDLPLSLECDFAIVSALLPDGDGRRLARDFVRAGARVLLIDNVGIVPLFDAWSLGATPRFEPGTPAEWLDELAAGDDVEAVSRAGRLMEALRLADVVDSCAAFSGASGLPVSFVRIRPNDGNRSSLEEMLDRLTSVVGMSTVFHDTPSGERIALVLNGDRRRLVKLLDSPEVRSHSDVAVVEVSAEDDLSSLIGRSLLGLDRSNGDEDTTRILLALSQNHDKTVETVRLALHRLDFSPLFRDATFKFEDSRTNQPAAVVVDLRQTEKDPFELIDEALSQTPPIPVLAMAEEGDTDSLAEALRAGASDYAVWPFEPGELEAALARVVAVAPQHLKSRPSPHRPTESVVSESEDETVGFVGAPVEAESMETPVELEAAVETTGEAEPFTAPDEGEIDSEMPDETAADAEIEMPSSVEVEAILATVIGERLATGEEVLLDGVGVLRSHHETSRIVHDSHGRTIVEPPRMSLSFEPEDAAEDDDQGLDE